MRPHPQPAGHTLHCAGVRFQHLPSAWLGEPADEAPTGLVRLVVVLTAGLLLLSLL